MRATAPGSPCAQQGSGGCDLHRDVALGRPQLELRGDRAAELAELQRLAAQRHLGVQAAEVEQVRGEVRERMRLLARPRRALARVLEVQLRGVEVVLEQLQHPVERGQRGAQLVRGGRHERPPGRLLAAQLRLHARERAGELAHLVRPAVVRQGVGLEAAHPAALELARRVAQALQAAQQRGGEPHAEQQRDQQPRGGGLDERLLHDLHRGGHVIQALDQHHHVAPAGDPDRLGHDQLVADQRVHGWRVRRARRTWP